MSTVALSSALGALPARFRRERLLIVGCGDVGSRVARNLAQGAGAGRMRVLALTSSPDRRAALRQLGATPVLGNLDDAASLRRLAANSCGNSFSSVSENSSYRTRADGSGAVAAWPGDPMEV